MCGGVCAFVYVKGQLVLGLWGWGGLGRGGNIMVNGVYAQQD